MSGLESFKSSFKGDLVTPSDEGYGGAIARWAGNAARRAKVVAFVKDEADVATAIAYARTEKMPFAVRGGGHSASGTSSQQDGLVIDLSRYLNTAKVDPEKKIAYVGGGAIWETVDKAAIEHGLASVGGTVNHTGVGGLTLGGGIGWLAGKHGLVIDNLIQATVVVANGQALRASKDENEDLFWAIRGGGGNFGVVTEFVLQLHEQRRTVYAGTLIFPGNVVEDVFNAVKQWWEKGTSGDEGMIVGVTRSPPPHLAPCLVANIFFNGSEQEGRENFKFLHDLKPIMDLTKEIPYEQVNALMNHMVHHGQGVYLRGGIQTGVHADRMPQLLNLVASLSEPEADGSSFRILAGLELFSLGSIIKKASNTDMAFNGRGHRTNVLLNVMWDALTPENEAKARAKTDAMSKLLNEFEGEDSIKTQAYSNYSHGIDIGGGAAALFGENYPRLQKIKGKYDPDNIFNKWFAIKPVVA